MVIPLVVYTDTRSPEAFFVSMAEDYDEKVAPMTVTAQPTAGLSERPRNQIKLMTKDEYHLATLGYRQVLIRGLGLFENWAATFTTMNFVSGMPILLGFALATGGPQAAFSNWTMVGGLSLVVSFALAEIAAAFPTAGGIYYWSYRLGGTKWGPFLSWLTAWWNWAGWIAVVPGCQQGATNFFIAALQIRYPNASVLSKRWFLFVCTTAGLLVAVVPNILDQRVLRRYFRVTVFSACVLFMIYWVWFPIASRGHFQPASGVFGHFYNGINYGPTQQASDAYCWIVGILFGAWEFYGYDTSVHLAEETNEASEVVAKGMWTGTLATWLLSVPTLVILLFCIRDFDAIVNGTYANNFAELCLQALGPKGATAVLILCWLDGTCGTTICILSAQRVTYAISRDGLLPGSKYLCKLSTNKRIPVNAALVVLAFGIAISCIIVGSEVAFFALTATATIATNVSYLIPIVARQTVGRKQFRPAKWHLGRFSVPCAIVGGTYISFLFVVLCLPQVYPVTALTLNYAPIMIGGVTVLTVIGWIFPFGLGGKYWFHGPLRTISEQEVSKARVVGLDD